MKSKSGLRLVQMALCVSFVFTSVALRAEVRCPVIFGDRMVLQRALPVPVWGDAVPGEAVTVEFSGQHVTTVADSNGRWRVSLAPLPANAQPQALVIRGSNTLTYQDVLVGEVWFCSGQSNMEKPLGPRKGQKPTEDYEAELTRAACPNLRIFQVPHYAKAKPGSAALTWQTCNGETLMATGFSAAAYYFGRELERELGVPIGLVHSSFGGTRIEAWMPPDAFEADPQLRALEHVPYAHWVDGVQATELYASMVAPFVPYAVRGFLWYQGEENCQQAESTLYTRKMRALIQSWRAAWQRADAPFYYALLAPFIYSHQKHWAKQLTPEALPVFWTAQIAAADVPGTGFISTSDLAGSGRDIHPTNKRDVGLRFARLALSESYGRSGPPARSPVFKTAKTVRDGSAMEIEFTPAVSLQTREGAPADEFTIAGADRVFYPADAVIRGATVVVSSPAVPQPLAVRFAWHELAMPNLVNAAGLPAVTFRTDDWPVVLETSKPPAPK